VYLSPKFARAPLLAARRRDGVHAERIVRAPPLTAGSHKVGQVSCSTKLTLQTRSLWWCRRSSNLLVTPSVCKPRTLAWLIGARAFCSPPTPTRRACCHSRTHHRAAGRGSRRDVWNASAHALCERALVFSAEHRSLCCPACARRPVQQNEITHSLHSAVHSWRASDGSGAESAISMTCALRNSAAYHLLGMTAAQHELLDEQSRVRSSMRAQMERVVRDVCRAGSPPPPLTSGDDNDTDDEPTFRIDSVTFRIDGVTAHRADQKQTATMNSSASQSLSTRLDECNEVRRINVICHRVNAHQFTHVTTAVERPHATAAAAAAARRERVRTVGWMRRHKARQWCCDAHCTALRREFGAARLRVVELHGAVHTEERRVRWMRLRLQLGVVFDERLGGVRTLASQAAGDQRSISRQTGKEDSAVLCILHDYDRFADRSQQTLLVQFVRLCALGRARRGARRVTPRFDSLERLEKRIRSRSGLRQIVLTDYLVDDVWHIVRCWLTTTDNADWNDAARCRAGRRRRRCCVAAGARRVARLASVSAFGSGGACQHAEARRCDVGVDRFVRRHRRARR
jgi:hypothetical protein